jgi:hypothetical protein
MRIEIGFELSSASLVDLAKELADQRALAIAVALTAGAGELLSPMFRQNMLDILGELERRDALGPV